MLLDVYWLGKMHFKNALLMAAATAQARFFFRMQLLHQNPFKYIFLHNFLNSCVNLCIQMDIYTHMLIYLC